MTDSSSPRGSSPESPHLERLLRSARQDVASPEELRSVALGLAGVLDVPSAVPDPSAAATLGAAKVSGAGAVAKLSAAVALVGAASVAVVWGVTKQQHPAPVAAASAPREATLEPPAPTMALPSLPAPEVPPGGESPAETSGSGETAGEAVRRAGPSHARARVTELHLLRQAQRELNTNAAKTVELCRQHARAFPDGQLAQEREVLLIEALRRLNRDTEAKRRQQRFEDEYPGSALQPRVSDQPLPSASDR